MNSEEVVQAAHTAGLRLIRFLYCDNGGVIRGKLTHIDGLERRLKGGIGLTVAMQAFNMLDHLVPFEGMGPVGEVRIMPDPDTFRILPYAPSSAAMLSDLLTLDGKAWEACPRSFLKRMIARATQQGFTIQTAMENEFILCREQDGQMIPADEALCFSSVGMHDMRFVIDDMVAAFESMGIQVDLYHPEYGPGQHEITITRADALTAADLQIFYRETVRSVAWNHGFFASFAPKPFPNLPGNGCHIHCSLWDPDGKTNLMWSEHNQYHISKLGYHFMAGILDHLPALIALTCPSFNSYRRIKPHMWAGAFAGWGPDNREAAVRVASPFWGQEVNSTNFELKASDPSNNPYLALGGVIAAGLDGLNRQLDPGEPLLVDPCDMSEEELERRHIRPLPTSLAEAVDNLEKDEVLMEALGSLLLQSYVAVKRSEVSAFAAEDVNFELKHHFYIF
jgi:glutamine synthetase